MTRREILNQAKLKLNSGYSKQETFDELNKLNVISSIELAKIVKLLPTKSQKDNLKIFHLLCMITFTLFVGINTILILNGTINFSGFDTVVFLFISILNIIGMSYHNSTFYITSAMLSFFYIIGFILKVGIDHFTILDFLNCSFVLILIPSAIFMYLKLQIKFVEKKVKNNENEFENKIIFEEK